MVSLERNPKVAAGLVDVVEEAFVQSGPEKRVAMHPGCQRL